MPGGFIRKGPSDSSKLHEHPEVVDLFTRANWISFFDKIQGHDEEITQEFLMSLRPQSKTHATVSFMDLTLELTPKLIVQLLIYHWGFLGAKKRYHWAKLLRSHSFFSWSIL